MLALHCEEGDLRLIGGSTINQGMVEVCKNETWGNICSTNRQWGQPEANVTCRQLGFSQHGISYYTHSCSIQSLWSYNVHAGAMARLDFSIGQAYYNNILCTGRETWLIDCQRDTIGSSCYPTVGVQCSYNYLCMFVCCIVQPSLLYS